MFTSDEIEGALEKLIRSSIRRPIDTLGARRLDVPFSDTQEATAGVFLLHPKAPYYVLFLGVQKLAAAVAKEAETLALLLAAIEATDRNVLPINDITPLSNAKVALDELEGAVDARDSAFADVTKVPAFVRYSANVDLFLQTSGSNVKSGGDIVQTPQEGRESIPTLLRDLKLAHEEVIRVVKLLAEGQNNYAKVNLPALVAKGIISRSKEILGEQVKELSNLTPTARLAKLRKLLLDLVAQKAVVRKFATFVPPNATLSIAGLGHPYADAAHPATPAMVVLGAPGPYPSHVGRNILDLWLDVGPVDPKIGGSPLAPTVNIAPVSGNTGQFISISPTLFASTVLGDLLYIVSAGPNGGSRWVVTSLVAPNQVLAVGIAPAEVESGAGVRSWPAPTHLLTLASAFTPDLRATINEPYDITVANEQFGINDNGNPLSVVFAHGTGLTADDIVADFNAQLPGAGNFVAEAFFSTLIFSGPVTIASLGGNNIRFTPITGDFTAIVGQLKIDDLVFVKEGPNAGTRWTVTAKSTTQIDAAGSVPAIAEASRSVDMGRNRRIRIYSPDVAMALTLRSTLTITQDPIFDGAAGTLGFFPGLSSTARPLQAQELKDSINAQQTNVVASTVFSPSFEGQARSDPFFPTKLVFYYLRGIGNITSALAGPNFTVTVEVPVGNVLSSGIAVGDILVLRSGSVLDAQYTITSVAADEIVADGTVQASVGTDIEIEVGPALTGVAYGAGVVIPSPSPNAGDHHVQSASSIPFELELQQALPMFQLNQRPILMSGVGVGHFTLQLDSTTTTINSYIRAAEAHQLLVSVGQLGVDGYMTTPWFQLPEVPQLLAVEDLLHFYGSSYSVPDEVHEIESIEKDLHIIQVTPDVAALPSSWDFSDNLNLPFARLKAGTIIDYESFRDKLNAWLALPSQQPAFFTQLNQKINPLLSNLNPSAVAVGDAKNQLRSLSAVLDLAGAESASADPDESLEGVLATFAMAQVPVVDTLLAALSERGADRAIDLLLEGQFVNFFDLEVDQASYAGNVLSNARAVAIYDLPVRKFSRPQSTQSSLIGSSDSPDAEYDLSDADQGLVPDPPVQGESL